MQATVVVDIAVCAQVPWWVVTGPISLAQGFLHYPA